jgi:MFS transporter, MHS family, proline/betaine transporter
MSQAIGIAPTRSVLPQVAGMIGNVLEWYDFAAYGFLAATFAGNFFPLENHMLSLLASYGVFAAAFVMRPLGGLLFGHIGDRVGRRRALVISVLAMAVPSFTIGLLPTYAGIGVLAPILLILLRMIQGVSIGGELTVSIVYLGERSTDRHRGVSASLSFVGAVVGTLIGSLLISTLDATLGAEAVRTWGWRIPFLGSAVLGALGLALRMTRLEETAEPISRVRRAPVIVAFTTEWRAMLLAFLISIPSGAAYYVGFIYLVTFAHQYDALPAAQANLVVTGGLVTLLFGVPLAAALSDRVAASR